MKLLDRSSLTIVAVDETPNSPKIVPDPSPGYKKNFTSKMIRPTVPEFLYEKILDLCDRNSHIRNILTKIIEEGMNFWVLWQVEDIIFKPKEGYDHLFSEGELDFDRLAKELYQTTLTEEDICQTRKLKVRVHWSTWKRFNQKIEQQFFQTGEGLNYYHNFLTEGILLVIAGIKGWITIHPVRNQSRMTFRIFKTQKQ